MNNLENIRVILSNLSDGELSAVVESFTNNLDSNIIKGQLLAKSNVDNVNKLRFTRKEMSDMLINELTNRLLLKNIDLGKRNKVVTFLKNLSKFRFSYKSIK